MTISACRRPKRTDCRIFRSLPFSLKVLLENLLRSEDGRTVTDGDIQAMAGWLTERRSDREIAFRPARVLMQDFTGVPAVVDLAAMRDAMAALGGDPERINPLVPVDLVIDHSVIVDDFGNPQAFAHNVELEYQRNGERYRFLRWGQSAFRNFRVVPPGTGICHQVNLEYLSQTVWVNEDGERPVAYPDTLVGTDSHTTMVNGLSVLGWGVGGIEAEAAMLGQPISMLIPQVVGFRLTGKLREGITATDLVLTVTEMLRKKGVVGKFVEFYGPGLDHMVLEDRATIGNMSPEYGATCAIFPIDAETLRYLKHTGRDPERDRAGRGLCQGAGHVPRRRLPPSRSSPTRWRSTSTRSLPSIAGPKRPQDRVLLSEAKQKFLAALETEFKKGNGDDLRVPVKGEDFDIGHGDVVIAAITSCTNTSNPYVMIGAGLLARNARRQGPDASSRGSRPRWRREARWSANISPAPACRPNSTSSASTSSASAAPPASAIPGRCRRRSPRRSPRATSSPPRCFPATATSRAASTPTCGPTTSPRRRWSSPMRSPARCRST